MKSPIPFSNSMKAKEPIKSPVLAQLCHVLGLLYRAKYLITGLLEKKKRLYRRYRGHKSKKMYTSIRLHYNWCSSSHVMPMPDPAPMYYDSAWNSVVPIHNVDGDDPPPAGCPQWLEEKKKVNPTYDDGEGDEINRLAEAFIAHCHEKFRLEKQESYRMYQEMLARGL